MLRVLTAAPTADRHRTTVCSVARRTGTPRTLPAGRSSPHREGGGVQRSGDPCASRWGREALGILHWEPADLRAVTSKRPRASLLDHVVNVRHRAMPVESAGASGPLAQQLADRDYSGSRRMARDRG